jgi:hypothetical protein
MSEDRLLELLANRATEGLGPSETVELQRLLAEHPEVDEWELDLAAGAIELALGPEPDEELPEALRARILADAPPVLAATRAAQPISLAAVRARRSRLSTVSMAAGWAAAAVLAGLLLLPPQMPSPSVDEAATLRAELLASDALTVSWSATGDATGPEAEGDVVWSNERQAGVMRFRGLAINDPSVFQYQLWIFDEAQDERYPIDGGVFDVVQEGDEVLVRIDPKLEVVSPTLFAVTIEKPGGVVVSSRERIAVLATVQS